MRDRRIGINLDELADGLIVVLEGEDDGSDLLQEVLGAGEVDDQAGRGQVDAGRPEKFRGWGRAETNYTSENDAWFMP